MRFKLAIAVIAVAAFAGSASGAPPAAVTTDIPRDAAHPTDNAYVRIPSGGDLMNGVLLTASGAGAHPTLVLLHGFPGNEQNLDLAQAVRRAGFNVLTLHYRGSWGSPGKFSFTHAAEDADAAVAFLRDPAVAKKYGVDPDRLFVAGHSMGGFMAASAAAHDPRIRGLILISAWNIGDDFKGPRAAVKAALKKPGSEFQEDIIPLGGVTSDALADDVLDQPGAWDFRAWGPKIAPRPVLVITSEDGNAPTSQALEQSLKAAGDTAVSEVHFATDHSYTDHRIALEAAVVAWLSGR